MARRALIRLSGILDRMHNNCVRARGWRRNVLAFGAGLASVLSLAPFFLWPVLFLTIPILIWLIDGAGDRTGWRLPSALSAAVPGWWFGFGYFLASLFWIGEAFLVEAEKYALLLPFAVTLLPAGLAFFFAVAAACAKLFWPTGLGRVLALAIAIGATEWLRGHIFTGFPWNLLGYALTAPLPLMQITAVIGVYSLTLWTVLIAGAPLTVWVEKESGEPGLGVRMHGLVVAAVPLLAFFTFGMLELSRDRPTSVENVRLRIVQPSVPQAEKWKPENQGPIFRDHIALSLGNASVVGEGLTAGTFVIWPEAAMPFLPLEHPEAIAAIADMLPEGTQLLSGGLRLAKDEGSNGRRVFNSLIAFDEAGNTAAIYDKNHLVPFGEYLPFASVFRLIGLRGLVEMRGAFESGPVPRPLLRLAGLPTIGPLICYEAIFPGDVVQGKERPGLLLSITNDGWFGNTAGPRQHFHQARVRAVEEGLPVVRAANNGISAVIDANGRVLDVLGMNIRGAIDASLPGALPPTPYSKWGDGIVAINVLLFFLFIAIGHGRWRV